MAESYLEGSTNPSKGQHTGLELAKDTKLISVPQGLSEDLDTNGNQKQSRKIMTVKLY